MKYLLTFIFLALISVAFSQTVKVNKEPAEIKGEQAAGFSVDLVDASAEELQASLAKFLKSYGKARVSDNMIIIPQPVIQGTSYTAPIYALSKPKGNQVAAWVGIKPGEWSSSTEAVNKDLEKVIYDFGVFFYRERIQKQIDESMRALRTVERQQQKLINQNQDLNAKLEGNRQEKVNLEKALENNKLAYEDLLKKIAKNKSDQDSVAQAAEQIKKIIEMHREKQQKVH